MKFNSEKYVQMNILDKQKYIKLIKDKFERKLAFKLRLTRVSAPIIVTEQSGLQDDLSGTERKVSFDLLQDGRVVEIVQSLGKWKLMALKKYSIASYSGIYTDMTAIRRDDKMDELHSVYVDQWDWEKVILARDRTVDYLKKTVVKIVQAIAETGEYVSAKGFNCADVCKDVFFITAEQLLKAYPDMDAKQREYEITKKYKTVFIIGIGGALSDGNPHDLRAPDYDDWTLNGDLLMYHEVLDAALELSSMGVRVNAESMVAQLEARGNVERLEMDFHKAVVNGELPLSIGGGIGQSRLCMLLLGRAHIGEVQASYWDEDTLAACKRRGIELL